MYLTFHHFIFRYILNSFILLALGPRYYIRFRFPVTLYTAVGQPFTAKMAVVNLDTPYFKGHATVGLVANLAADALLGLFWQLINILNINILLDFFVRFRKIN
jgi:hypothetical protein